MTSDATTIRRPVEDRQIAAWYACGFGDTKRTAPKLCGLSAGEIKEQASNPPQPIGLRHPSAGPLHATVVEGPWIPFVDVDELLPWFAMWRRLPNLWQVVGLESEGEATKAHWGRLFTDIDKAAKAAAMPPVLFAGVAPGCADWYEQRLGFTPFAEIEEWDFAGGLPAVAMMRPYGRLVGDGERVARWNGAQNKEASNATR